MSATRFVPEIDLDATPNGASAAVEAPPTNRIEARGLTFAQLLRIPPPEWMIEGVLQRAPLSVVFGRGGSFKSFIVLDWSLHAAMGAPWHGLAVTKETVLYVAGEGAGGLGARAQAWAKAHGVTEVEDFLLFPGAVNFLDSAQVAEVIDYARTQEATLVILDTLRRSMVGGEENSSTDIGRVFSNAGQIHEDTGARTIIIHHANRASGDFRGSSAIYDDSDNVLKVERNEGEAKNTALITGAKTKDGAELEGLVVTLSKVEFTDLTSGQPGESLVVSGVTRTSDVAIAQRGAEELAIIRAVVRECDSESLSPTQAVEEVVARTKFIRKRVRDLRDEYVETGLLVVEGRGQKRALRVTPELRWTLDLQS